MNVSPYVAFFVLGCLIASFAQILLKKSANKTYTSALREYLNPHVIVGYGMMMCGMLCNIFAYSHGVDYKFGPVFESFGFPFVLILSRVFFKEPITRRKVIGNAMIVVGIVIFSI